MRIADANIMTCMGGLQCLCKTLFLKEIATMKFGQFLTMLLCAISLFSCSKKDDNNVITPIVFPPATIYATRLTLNNVNTNNVPAGQSINYIKVQMYAGNVLLVTSDNISLNNLPTFDNFSGPAFSYSNKAYDLKYTAYLTNSSSVLLGTVHLELKDYSSDTYPKPQSLFYNVDGFAGTLELSYN